MAPPRRNRNAVDYSQFGSVDDDDDEDFAKITAPSSKRSKRTCPELTNGKIERKPLKEEIHFQESPLNKRIALDHRLYQRDLEVALALSMNEPPGTNHKVQDSQGQVLAEESEGDSSFCGEVDVKKKTIGSRKEGRQLNAENKEKEKKPSKSERDLMGKSEPALQNLSSSLEQIEQPLKTPSPSLAKKPKWTSPASSGSSPILLGRTHRKSPTQGLRLGLSRLARVKSLHPSFAST